MARGDVYTVEIGTAADVNTTYRRVLCTTPHMQVTIMTVGGDGATRVGIGEGPTGEEPEMHPFSDQLIRVERGAGTLTTWDPVTGVALETPVAEEGYPHAVPGSKSLMVITAGTPHLIVWRSGAPPLRVYAVYSPPHHLPTAP